MSPHDVNVALHVAGGAAGLLVGAFVIATRKGETLHKRVGRVFVWLGGLSLVTALVGVFYFDPLPPLISATLAFGYQYLSGLRVLQLKTSGPNLMDALLAALGLAGCAALYLSMGSGTEAWPPIIGYSAIGYTSSVAVYDLSRHFWADAWLKHVRRIDHGLKMTGAYFAMMSAGVGNVFRDLQPWSQVGPSALGMLVMVVLLVAYAAGMRGAGRGAV